MSPLLEIAFSRELMRVTHEFYAGVEKIGLQGGTGEAFVTRRLSTCIKLASVDLWLVCYMCTLLVLFISRVYRVPGYICSFKKE